MNIGATRRGHSSRPFSIAASTPKLEVDNRFPLSKYYRTADNLLKQANIYREERNIVELYILLLRFSSLVGETICDHQDYPTSSLKERANYTKKLRQVLSELESLKPEVQKQVEKLNAAADRSSYENDATRKYEWPPVSRGPFLQDGVHDKNNGPYVSYRAPPTFQASQVFQNNGAFTSYGTSQTLQGPQTFQLKSYNIEDCLNNLSLSLPPPKDETLSRHSFLGPTGLRARWDTPISQARVQYPSYIDASPIEAPSLDMNQSNNLTVVEAPSTSAPTDFDAFMRKFDEKQLELDLRMPLRLTKEPPPPPVAAPVQSMPRILDALDSSKPFNDQMPPWKVADPSPGPVSSQKGEGPKQLYISTNMMDEFLKLAKKNTDNNLETCGVLAGSLRSATFYVTALIIPKQQATSDSCQTVNEEEIFDWQDKRSLFQLGWIHTHPKQTCFMSSVDLHTHYSYQVMLPEAIAIVMAPTDDTRKYGIFRLSDPGGIKVIQTCQMRGFHPHEEPSDGSPIYEHCGHVLMSSALKYQVIDLR